MIKDMNDFDVIAQMIRENNPGISASNAITNVKSGKKVGKITLEIDADKAQRIMQGAVGLKDPNMVVMLMLVDEDQLTETRNRMSNE